ncbi:hypothetical protein Dda_4904 [Drechslerella dactyloides]|uniref:Uncharacterized protein n=1 Tax=Drechslerella dactyloides TaxID=74499 RepID=A0AAD6NJN8_DREDA|nr:hypothetical protein Dda_4904 [Drechslerella dactyloides]
MAQTTWFLPPDFTFLPTGELKLGSVIKHPKRPTAILASIKDHFPEISLPDVQTLNEANHSHSRSSSSGGGVEIWAKFIDLASASGKISGDRFNSSNFGNSEHEIQTFATSLKEDSLKAIVNLAKVKKHIDSGLSGLFGQKRPVYIVSGLRIAKNSFNVSHDTGSGSHWSISGSGPAGAAAAVPVEVGAAVSADREKKSTDSYDTHPGIIFAYRLHVIRAHRDGDADAELFAHRTAFLTGEGDDDDDEDQGVMEMVDATGKVIGEDLEEEAQFEELVVGDERLVVFQ